MRAFFSGLSVSFMDGIYIKFWLLLLLNLPIKNELLRLEFEFLFCPIAL